MCQIFTPPVGCITVCHHLPAEARQQRSSLQHIVGSFAVYPLRCRLALLGFALRDSAAAPKARGGAHEGRHARGRGFPNPWRQRLRATPSGDELSRITSPRDHPVGAAGRACRRWSSGCARAGRSTRTTLVQGCTLPQLVTVGHRHARHAARGGPGGGGRGTWRRGRGRCRRVAPSRRATDCVRRGRGGRSG